MNLNTICMSVAFVASAAVILFAICLGIKLHHEEFSNKGDVIYKKRFVLSTFQIFLMCFFLGALVFFLPIYYLEEFKDSGGAIRVVETICYSIYNTMRLFLLDSDHLEIDCMLSQMSLHPMLLKGCTIFSSVLHVVAPIMTAGFVLSFLKNISSYLRYSFSFANRIYYISELNEKSIALAADVRSQRRFRRPMVVFFDVFESQEETNSELIDRAKRLGAVLFQKDIIAIGLKYWRRNLVRKFFFVGENEDENLKQALTLIDHCNANKRFNTENTHFYVFSTTVESEALLDSVDNGNMKVRRISENKNLVMHTFREQNLFENPWQKEENGPKEINVLIVGSGTYGVELLKTYCWCGQIPGYRLSIHVVDLAEDLPQKFSSIAPELVARAGLKEEGEPFYELHFHSGVDAMQGDFEKLLRELGPITTAFVTLGEDNLNVEVAMRIRREFGKLHLMNQYPLPKIFSVVYSTLKNQIFKHEGGLKSLGKHDYGISFIGDVRVRFSLKNIEQQELEEMGLAIHLSWLEHMKEELGGSAIDLARYNAMVKENSDAYQKYEYYRRASISTAVHQELLERLGIEWESPEQEQENEHKRWNAFMRAEGFVYHDKRDHIAKTHPDLVSYQKLSELERSKDGIVTAKK